VRENHQDHRLWSPLKISQHTHQATDNKPPNLIGARDPIFGTFPAVSIVEWGEDHLADWKRRGT
jgi:hypothetical protein